MQENFFSGKNNKTDEKNKRKRIENPAETTLHPTKNFKSNEEDSFQRWIPGDNLWLISEESDEEKNHSGAGNTVEYISDSEEHDTHVLNPTPKNKATITSQNSLDTTVEYHSEEEFGDPIRNSFENFSDPEIFSCNINSFESIPVSPIKATSRINLYKNSSFRSSFFSQISEQTPDTNANSNERFASLANHYNNLLEETISFEQENNFNENIEINNPKLFKEKFSPDKFINIEKHYNELSEKLTILKSKTTSAAYSDTENLIHIIQKHIDSIQQTIQRLHVIREEYVGNQENESRLKNQWENIKDDTSFKNSLPKNSDQWIYEHSFTVLTRMNEVKKSSDIEVYRKELSQKLRLDIDQFNQLHTDTRTVLFAL